jgi:hypothetical protein
MGGKRYLTAQKLANADVAYGSKADLRRRLAQVRFAPQSGRAGGHLDTSVKCQQPTFDAWRCASPPSIQARDVASR